MNQATLTENEVMFENGEEATVPVEFAKIIYYEPGQNRGYAMTEKGERVDFHMRDCFMVDCGATTPHITTNKPYNFAPRISIDHTCGKADYHEGIVFIRKGTTNGHCEASKWGFACFWNQALEKILRASTRIEPKQNPQLQPQNAQQPNKTTVPQAVSRRISLELLLEEGMGEEEARLLFAASGGNNAVKKERPRKPCQYQHRGRKRY